MPFIETPHDLADWLADKVGVYGAHVDDDCPSDENKAKCCRVCWTAIIVERMKSAVDNERRIAKGYAP